MTPIWKIATNLLTIVNIFIINEFKNKYGFNISCLSVSENKRAKLREYTYILYP